MSNTLAWWNCSAFTALYCMATLIGACLLLAICHLQASSCLLMYSIPESMYDVALQELLEARMGMSLAAMQEWAQKPPKVRDDQHMPGAHLPERGFYLVKSAQSNLKESRPPSYWKQLNVLWSRQQAPQQSLPQGAKAGSTVMK